MKKLMALFILTILVLITGGCGSKGESDEIVISQYSIKSMAVGSSYGIEFQHGNTVVLDFTDDNVEIKGVTAANGKVEKHSSTKYLYSAPYTGNSDTITVAYDDGDSKSVTYNITLKNKVTFMLYLSAENSLGRDNYNTDDMEEIAKVSMESNNRNVNVVVYVDTVSESDSTKTGNGCYYYSGNSDDTVIINGVTLKGFVKTEYYGTGNTGSASELTNFINYTKENFQSDKYVLDLWSHGDGWRESSYASTTKQISLDQGDRDSMDMWEVESAIKNSELPKMDVIYTDACLMGGIEVAYQLKDAADYLVFSPELTPGPGGDYEGILKALNSSYSSSEAIAKAIVNANDEFYKDYTITYTDTINGKKASVEYKYSYVFTAVDQSKLSDLTSAVEAAYTELMQSGNSALLSKIKSNKSSILCYSYDDNYEYNTNTMYVDIGSFWNKAETLMSSTAHTAALETYINNLQEALESYVIELKYGNGESYVSGSLYSTEDEDGTSGLSIYTDLANLNGSEEYSEYKTATYFGELSWWQSFLNDFYGI